MKVQCRRSVVETGEVMNSRSACIRERIALEEEIESVIVDDEE